MKKYKVAILGCGAIFSRHIMAIQGNSDNFELLGIFDPNTELQLKYTAQLQVKAYANEEAVYQDHDVNCVIILSPSYLHFPQAIQALNNKKNVIVEKPAAFLTEELKQLEVCAKEHGVEIFTILQVRLNPSIEIIKEVIQSNILGNIRGISLVQRWQRPQNYFSGWRGSMATGGGILREFAIHYLDVVQYLVGTPKISYSSFFKNKFKNCDVNDTIYALFDFGSFGGSMEVTIAAEPKNLECNLSIMSENGFIKLGGKSLDEILTADFLQDTLKEQFMQIQNKVMSNEIKSLATYGACPHHPELYRQIIINPHKFMIDQSFNVIQMVEDIYHF